MTLNDALRSLSHYRDVSPTIRYRPPFARDAGATTFCLSTFLMNDGTGGRARRVAWRAQRRRLTLATIFMRVRDETVCRERGRAFCAMMRREQKDR